MLRRSEPQRWRVTTFIPMCNMDVLSWDQFWKASEFGSPSQTWISAAMCCDFGTLWNLISLPSLTLEIMFFWRSKVLYDSKTRALNSDCFWRRGVLELENVSLHWSLNYKAFDRTKCWEYATTHCDLSNVGSRMCLSFGVSNTGG